MPRRRTLAEIIARAREVHGDKYDYSKAVYRGIHEKICIICPKHGEFWQEPNNHISRRTICPECSKEIKAETFRLTKEEFVEKANRVHKGRYDYSKADYKGTDEKICIICREHGDFWQLPHNHLHGFGCPKCSGTYVPTTEEFVESLRKKFGDVYDYSKVDYQGNKKKVCIICPKHGEFWVAPNNALNQRGCPKCIGYYHFDLPYFLEKAKERFGDKYDYTRVEWKGNRRKVCIVCPEHGEFWQSPYMHMRTLGCQKCSGSYMDQEYFIERAKQVHGDKYDYSKAKYEDSKSYVCIICPKHGEFYQKAHDHLIGHGCKKCYAEETKARLTKSEEDFLAIANQVHKGRYDYSEMQYIDRRTPIKIICSKHGPFFQTPKSHIRGAGCPMCNNSVLEEMVTSLLRKHDIAFTREKTFEWLSYNGTMFLDFYLQEYDIAIECQGLQHFQPIEFFGGQTMYEQTCERDKKKRKQCEEHGITMLYFSNLGLKYPYPVIEDINILLKAIRSKGLSESPIWAPDPELPFTFEN